MISPVTSSAAKATLTIKDLQDKLGERAKLKIQTLEDLFSDKRLQCLREAVELSGRYKEPGELENIDPIEVREDVIRLAALNINIAEMAGVLAGRVQVGEDAMKMEKAETFLALKDIKESLESEGTTRVKVTEKEIEAATRVRTKEILDMISDDRILGEYTKFAYYAIQEFGRVLQSAAYKVQSAEDRSVKIS